MGKKLNEIFFFRQMMKKVFHFVGLINYLGVFMSKRKNKRIFFFCRWDRKGNYLATTNDGRKRRILEIFRVVDDMLLCNCGHSVIKYPVEINQIMFQKESNLL